MGDQLNDGAPPPRPDAETPATGPAAVPCDTAAAARAAAVGAARDCYGRLVAWLAVRAGDIAGAEDALSDAFVAALETWPRDGVPAAPDAWLLTAARRRLIDSERRNGVRRAAAPALAQALEEAHAAEAAQADGARGGPPDERLKLLFICAHPAIDASIRTPLMLQTVLGLDAARIAGPFLASPAAMAQRLVRAKRKIAAARIPFETPDAAHLAERAPAVLEAIYAAFCVDFDAPFGDGVGGAATGDGLGPEALFLARLVSELAPRGAPAFAEAHGLRALIAYVSARRKARRADGIYTPFDDQDPALWDRRLIDEGDAALRRAAAAGRAGRFQLEAAIQSAHATRKLFGEDTRSAVVHLYERLIALSPTVGARIAHAAALAAADKPADAQHALMALSEDAAHQVESHQPYWACLAETKARLGDSDGARCALDRAVGLTVDPAARDYLAAKRRTI